jgi:hypothetical protein
MDTPQPELQETSTHVTPHPSPQIDRRSFLARTGASAAAGATVGTLGIPALEQEAAAADPATDRARLCANIKRDAATYNQHLPIPNQLSNGDEARYPSRIGNYSKCLKHHPLTGEVDPVAYNAFLAALASTNPNAVESLVTNGHFGNPDQATRRRLVNPHAAYAFDLEGADSHQLAMRPAPAFASAEEAGEMVELYWMALLRDIPFAYWETDPTVAAACDDLSNLSDFRGPKQNGQVTPQTLFRDTYFGCTDGPYISQFLLQPAAFGAQRVDQRIRSNAPGSDFLTTFEAWLDVQNGVQSPTAIPPGGLVFCNDGRALGQYVHVDVLFQAYFVAFLLLAGDGYPVDATNPYGSVLDPGYGAPLPPGSAGTQAHTGFGTFGGPGIATFVTEPSSRALKAQWYQKWQVHRRLRPEEFGGRVEVQRLGRASYPFHADLASSTVLGEVFSRFGSHLLPVAFPEGSPNHTSYGSGHATVGGACVTMLKAFFDETAEIANPVMPSADGSALLPYEGPPLTVGGELNKLVSNISQGRNIAGVHWRTDAVEANKLGESVATSILRDTRTQGHYFESFTGYRLTKFDGTQVTI